MRDNNSVEIIQQLHNEGYFKKAQQWYADLFLFPYVQRVYQFLSVLIITIGAYISIEVASTDYIQTKIPFAIYFDEQLDYIPRLKAVAKGNESINDAYARYFLQYYISLYETYDISWEEKKYLLQAISSLRIYDYYLRMMDPNQNPDSPILRYKGHSTRSIEVIDIAFHNEAFPDRATVTFKAIERSKQDLANTNESTWQAEIEFAMTDFNKVISDKIKPKFTVTKYNSTLVG